MDVVIFGSINMDLIARVSKLPAVGETIIGQNFETLPGGKGANQAVAVARLGMSVAMIGRVGNDAFGQQLIQGMRAIGVTCDHTVISSGESSGVAVVEVDDHGENRIIVIPGANNCVNADDLANLGTYIAQANVLMLQLEIPIPFVVAAAQMAFRAGVTVILDPAPANPNLPDELFEWVSVLTPNQLEASQLTGFSVETRSDAQKAAEILQKKGVDTVIVKLGHDGSLCVTHDDVIHTPSFLVNVVDTVAAGDAFNGGLAVALAEGRSIRDSLNWATAVAALAVSRQGAQSAMPTRADLHTFFTVQGVTL